eukprot:1160793-Pelagomonas_calceolata.AAC.16
MYPGTYSNIAPSVVKSWLPAKYQCSKLVQGAHSAASLAVPSLFHVGSVIRFGAVLLPAYTILSMLAAQALPALVSGIRCLFLAISLRMNQKLLSCYAVSCARHPKRQRKTTAEVLVQGLMSHRRPNILHRRKKTLHVLHRPHQGPTKLRRLAGADASGSIAAEGEDDEEGHDYEKALVRVCVSPVTMDSCPSEFHTSNRGASTFRGGLCKQHSCIQEYCQDCALVKIAWSWLTPDAKGAAKNQQCQKSGQPSRFGLMPHCNQMIL